MGRPGRAAPAAGTSVRTACVRPRTIVPLDTRTDWDRAVRHEDARVARYGRPASVLVVDVAMAANGGEDRFVARLGSAIRTQVRETDRVARVSADAVPRPAARDRRARGHRPG